MAPPPSRSSYSLSSFPSSSSSSSSLSPSSPSSSSSLLESSHSTSLATDSQSSSHSHSHSHSPPFSFPGEPCYPGPCVSSPSSLNKSPLPAPENSSPPPPPEPEEKEEPIDDSIHYLAKIPEAPTDLGDQFSCSSCRVSQDRKQLNRIMERIRFRQQSLESQDAWLRDANNAIENLKREMGIAQTQRDNTQSDLNTLFDVKQRLTMQIRSDQLKRDLDEAKQSLSEVKEKQQSLIDYKVELKSKKDEVTKKIGDVQKQLNQLPPIKDLKLDQ